LLPPVRSAGRMEILAASSMAPGTVPGAFQTRPLRTKKIVSYLTPQNGCSAP
jgi:hypothetical protein